MPEVLSYQNSLVKLGIYRATCTFFFVSPNGLNAFNLSLQVMLHKSLIILVALFF